MDSARTNTYASISGQRWSVRSRETSAPHNSHVRHADPSLTFLGWVPSSRLLVASRASRAAATIQATPTLMRTVAPPIMRPTNAGFMTRSYPAPHRIRHHENVSPSPPGGTEGRSSPRRFWPSVLDTPPRWFTLAGAIQRGHLAPGGLSAVVPRYPSAKGSSSRSPAVANTRCTWGGPGMMVSETPAARPSLTAMMRERIPEESRNVRPRRSTSTAEDPLLNASLEELPYRGKPFQVELADQPDVADGAFLGDNSFEHGGSLLSSLSAATR